MKCFAGGDSTIVLAWLKNDRKYKQFVSNRTQEILKLTRPEMWRHCPTDSNPADIRTRGESPVHLKEILCGSKDPPGSRGGISLLGLGLGLGLGLNSGLTSSVRNGDKVIFTLYLAWCFLRTIDISHIPRCYGNPVTMATTVLCK